ncbi:MAG TPA: ABC transporter substrate-binding protein [Alphaproteobacteria bacterium]|nr:ABC transporter substrate-binding protein [Alphaproteobacteria bacterium]
MSRLFWALLGLAAAATLQPARAETAIRFCTDWVFDGSTGYVLRADANGYFKDAGLAVTIDRGFGAGDPVTKVASGAYDLALADISALIEFNARHPERPLTAIMMVYDKSPFSLITLADKNIRTFGDLRGRKIGALANETITRLFPVLARLNGFDAGQTTMQYVNGQVRDTLLKAGQVDAVIGFFSTSPLNLESVGVPEDQVRVFKYSDYGMDLYGSALITSAAYAAENPKAVTAFTAALARSLAETIKDPASAIPAVKARNSLADEKIELRRLKIVLSDLVVTPYTREHGFGDVDRARLAREIGFLAEALELPGKPSPDSVFTSAFLPDAAKRQVQ